MKPMKFFTQFLLPFLLLFLAVGAAQAAAVDVNVTEATEQLGKIAAGIAAVGAILLGLAALAVAYKWVKATIFS